MDFHAKFCSVPTTKHEAPNFSKLMEINSYLVNLRNQLLGNDNWHNVIMDRKWASQIPIVAGVYVLKQNENIIYVGETGSLQGRMYDFLDSRKHSVRRTIGKKIFSSEEGFIQATERLKFPEHIEVMLNNHICSNLLLAYLEVPLGRKELEELIEREIKVELRLNKRGKRK